MRLLRAFPAKSGNALSASAQLLAQFFDQRPEMLVGFDAIDKAGAQLID